MADEKGPEADENAAPSPKKPMVRRDERGRLLPGSVINPGGRPREKGLAALVREMTDDGRRIVEIVAGILADTETSNRDRLEAAKILLDRGFGKAVETSLNVNASAGEALELAALADSQLEHLVAGLRARSSETPALPIRIPADTLDGATISATIPPAE